MQVLAAEAHQVVDARPTERDLPAVGGIEKCSKIALPSVVLPHPDLADQRQRLARLWIFKSTPSTAFTCPTVRLNDALLYREMKL